MDLDLYTQQLRSELGVENKLVDIKALYRQFPHLDPNSFDDQNLASRPLIHLAIEEEKPDLVQFVLFGTEIKASPDLVDPVTGLTPLCAAIE